MQPKMIYDAIHGNIELSDLEAKILKSSITNRLHQVLQNSTAYLVFPSCKTSRFEHSLGVMNYASDLFINGLKNSKTVKVEYLKEKGSVISRLMESKKAIFEKYFDENIPEKQRPYILLTFLKTQLGKDVTIFNKFIDNPITCDKLNIELSLIIGDVFIEKKLGIDESKMLSRDKFTLLVLFQTIRLYGLLHDIGHLPFSHVFEFAIEAVREIRIKDASTLKTKKGKDDKSIVEKIKDIVEAGNGDKIHEAIGKVITRLLLEELKRDLCQDKSLSDDQKKLRTIIFSCIELCYNEIRVPSSSEFASLYEIVSSAVDADRMDFVQRDGYVSGISKAAGNLERIIKMFYLTKISTSEKDNYRFLPAFQSLHDVEKLLHDRFHIYKYMVNHHSVKRSDYILQKNIEGLFLKEIGDTNIDQATEDPNYIIGIINIIHLLLFGEDRDIYIRLDKLSQLTDYRLLSLFAQKYIENKTEDEQTDGFYLLSEIYESKRSFTSLWKRIYNYEDFKIKLGKALNESGIDLHIDFGSIYLDTINLGENEKGNERDKTSIYLIEAAFNEYDVKKAAGFNNNDDYKWLAKFAIDILINEDEGNWCRKIENYALADANKNELIIFVVRTNIGNGILKQEYDKVTGKPTYKSKLKLVDNKNGIDILKIDEMSLLPETLLNEENNSMKFFVYYKDTKGEDNKVKEGVVNKIIVDTILVNVKEIISTFATL